MTFLNDNLCELYLVHILINPILFENLYIKIGV